MLRWKYVGQALKIRWWRHRVGSSPTTGTKYNPNLFPIGDGFGFIVFFDRYETTHFRNGVERKPTSKPRGPRKKKKSI